MKREDLTKLGLTDEAQIDNIMKLHGTDIEAHKSNILTLTGERDAAQKQLTEATKQIDAFKGMDIEGVKKAAADWETKAKQIEQQSTAELANVRFERDLDSALVGSKVRYTNEVRARLNLDDLRDATGKFIPERFTEQAKTIKSESPDLFSDTPEPPRITTGGGNQLPVQGDKLTDAIRKAANLPAPK